MDLRLDHASPVPLYHQIAEAIRYRIATGAIAAGATLPPLRRAAALWGANLHTVRRAYTELVRAGVVATRVAQGTVVLPRSGPDRRTRRGGARLDSLLDRFLSEALQRHGIGPVELIDLMQSRLSPASPRAGATAFVAECSETQSADLAKQLMARWQVVATPWTIDRPAPPAGHPIVATYFHFNEVRTRWTERLADVHFLAIRPDPELGERLRRFARGRRKVAVILCEREREMLHNILADLTRLLPPDRFEVRPQLVRAPDRWLAAHRSRQPLLFSPRMWGELSERSREDPRANEARFVFESADLTGIGMTLGWKPR